MIYAKKTIRFFTGIVVLLFLSVSLVIAQSGPKVSGYAKTSFQHTENMSETKVSNARIKVSGSIDDATEYTVFLDAVRDDVLLDAFVSRKIVDGLAVKIGQYKTPFSTDNLTSGTKIEFINRPYMKNDASPAFRDKGVQLTYSHRYFDAIAAVMNGSGQNKADYNHNKTMAYRVVAKVLPQLNLSGNYSTGNNSAADDETDDFVNVGANGTLGAIAYSAEYAQKTHGSLKNNAYFAWISYDIEMDSRFVKILTPAVRAEMSDPDTDTDDDAKSRYTLGLTAHLAKKYANRVMVNYEIREVETGDTANMFGIEYQIKF